MLQVPTGVQKLVPLPAYIGQSSIDGDSVACQQVESVDVEQLAHLVALPAGRLHALTHCSSSSDWLIIVRIQYFCKSTNK